MSRQQLNDVQEQLDHVLTLLDRVERSTDKMETVLMVREPSSSAAAEAYEGLRRQVVTTASDRRAHLAQLAEFELAVRGGAKPDQLLKMIDAWSDQAGLVRHTRLDDGDVDLLFERVGDPTDPPTVIRPAYLDRASGQVVRQGRIRHNPATEPAPPADSEPEETP